MGEGGTRSRAIRFYKELVSLRKQLSKIISEGSTQWLIVNDREDKLYFTRKLEGQIIYVYFNQSKEPWVVEQENEVILSQNCQLLEDGKQRYDNTDF